MTIEETQLRNTVMDINPIIADSCFNFTAKMSREEAEDYLKKNSTAPFLVRNSSHSGKFAISYFDDTGKCIHLLVSPPEASNPDFIVALRSGEHVGIKIAIENLITTYQQRIQPIKFLAQKMNKIDVNQMAVFSIQTLDHQKIALAANELDAYAQKNPDLKAFGDGHTGFAIAKALRAPFTVVRSQGNREENNKILKNHVGNNGLLVITGHGSPGGSRIEGNYIDPEKERRFQQQIERGPVDIVSSALEAGLKPGDSISILLCICYGAKDKMDEPSFAIKLAKGFAAQGISTTIIASDKPVQRFGYGVMVDDTLTFNDKVGMAADDVHIFSTQVDAPTSAPKIEITKTPTTIKLNHQGLKLTDAHEHSLPIEDTDKEEARRLAAEQTKRQAAERHADRLFSQHQKTLDNILSQLENKIGEIDQHQNPKARQAAIKLKKNLREAYNTLFKQGDDFSFLAKLNGGYKKAEETFIEQCNTAIEGAKPILEQDLGWGDYLSNVFKSIYNAIAGVFTSNPAAFYKYKSPQSKDEVMQVENQLNQNRLSFGG